MLRVELSTQLMRVRTLVTLAALAAVPAIAGLTTLSHAGRRNGNQSGLFGASTFSASNHAAASLAFIAPLLLPLVVCLLATAIASSDRDWGTLRYLYLQPVTRLRLLTGKLAATAIACLLATASVLGAGLLTGVVLFGWHRFHIIGGRDLSSGLAAAALLQAGGYTVVCMSSIAAIAFALGIILPRGPEALGASVAFVVVASILNAQSSLHSVATLLPVHYWQDWTHLLDRSPASLRTGAAVQLAWLAAAVAAGMLVLVHRDPAA
ncbi:MAG: ABC transporter permease subunit [Actinomycetota bacterium]|nr:ABC transporter permease subunit [Actinomycetota bacterium]